MRVEPVPRAATLPVQRPPAAITTTPSSTLPLNRAEDIGYGAGLGFGVRPTHRPSTSNASTIGMDEFGIRPPVVPSTSASTSVTGRRPTSSRLTVTNMPGELSLPQTQARSGGTRSLWPRAEDEKERLYESARAKVERVQGNVARPVTPVC